MKKFVLLAQKLFLTDRHIPQDPETRELLSELLEYILLQDNRIEELERRIDSARVALNKDA